MVSQPQSSAAESMSAQELELLAIQYIQCIESIKEKQSNLFDLRVKEAELNHRLFVQFGPRPVDIPILFDGATWSVSITDRFGEFHRVSRLTGLDEVAPSNVVEIPDRRAAS